MSEQARSRTVALVMRIRLANGSRAYSNPVMGSNHGVKP